MRNYAGNRLSPWLGHLMVSRSETPRPLLTPGEIMQLPAGDEIVMVSGVHPIRAKKARYFEDARFVERVLPAPKAGAAPAVARPDDWSQLPLPRVVIVEPDKKPKPPTTRKKPKPDDDESGSGTLRREPGLPEHEEVVPPKPDPVSEFGFGDDFQDDRLVSAAELRRQTGGLARQAALDPADDLDM